MPPVVKIACIIFCIIILFYCLQLLFISFLIQREPYRSRWNLLKGAILALIDRTFHNDDNNDIDF